MGGIKYTDFMPRWMRDGEEDPLDGFAGNCPNAGELNREIEEERLKAVAAEGLRLRKEIEARIAPMRALTAEDLDRRCR